ncbi:MAG: glutamate racemase [Candidatus Latescibacterota bacterium]|nr:MAG: glutamate racemase [Candidatus Latescibacterota bacterium]
MGRRVGIFDSGVGGLSVWREIVHQHPTLETCYVADQAHIPYGSRSAAAILEHARGIVRYLADNACSAIVVACNTASAVALRPLRAEFPHLRFVGMEPAVKPAAFSSRAKVIAVLATPATLDGELFAATVDRFAANAQVIRQPCPGLVEQIETGDTEGKVLDPLLHRCLQSALDAHADTIVLACTHYPFARRRIQQIVGPHVQVIDPAPAVARQVGRVVAASPGATAAHEFCTTGSASEFERVARRLLRQPLRARALRWDEGRLREA